MGNYVPYKITNRTRTDACIRNKEGRLLGTVSRNADGTWRGWSQHTGNVGTQFCSCPSAAYAVFTAEEA